MMKKKFVVMLVLLAIVAAPAMAGYRLVFVTSTQHDAVSDDIAVYNDWVQGLADAAGIGMGGQYGDLKWNVVGSTATVDARDNTGTNPFDPTHADVPIYLVDGTTLVASGNADLWDGEYTGGGQDNVAGTGIQHIINLTENGDVSSPWPWTGTYLDGTATYPLGGSNVQQGQSNDTTRWIWRQWTNKPGTNLNNFYAMSEVIPEPATIALLGFGGLALLRRRKK